MPPRDYDFQFGDGVFAPDCTVTLKKENWRDWHAPQLSASFGEESFYVDPTHAAVKPRKYTVFVDEPITLP